MADTKISALSDGGPLQETDQIPIVRGGANYRAQPSAMTATNMDGGNASSVYGGAITIDGGNA